jgi:putative transposase
MRDNANEKEFSSFECSTFMGSLQCKNNQVELHWIEPGKPTQNAYIERFNGTFRREVLNAHTFRSLVHTRQLVAEWLVEYNTQRPHQALGFMTPLEFRLAV